MKIGLFTDAPKHNLALMKLSAYYKREGADVFFNMPLWSVDRSFASILFKWNANKFIADEYGGSGVSDTRDTLPKEIERCRPDYSLSQRML